MPQIFGFTVSAPKLPSWNQVRSTVTHTAQAATQMGRSALSHARNLGAQGVDLGRRAIANPDRAVRELASAARGGIHRVETAAQNGIRSGVMATGRVIHSGANAARSMVHGNGVVAQVTRGAITHVENQARFTVGVVGGLAKEGAGLVGTVATVGTYATELQYSQSARTAFGHAITSGVSRGSVAVADYARSVAANPSRVASDVRGAAATTWNAGSGFVHGQIARHEAAFRRGEGPETIGMTTGQVASYFIPVGAGAKAAATGVRGAEAIAVGGARTLVRDGGGAALRAAGAETRVGTLAASPAARQAAEVSGARLLKGAEAGGGTVRVARSGGVTAQDLAAASRQSGREVALYRNTATNERFVAVGTNTGVEVPQGSRVIVHTQPGTGAAAVRASVADEAALSRLGQRSSVIIDQGGTSATRFRATEEGAALAKGRSGPVELNSPKVNDPGKVLRDAGIEPPVGMRQPHAHHVVYENGIGKAQQALVKEGQDILRRNGIDPTKGLENLVWAPNAKGQHTLANLRAVVDELKVADAGGFGKDAIADVLKTHGKLASER
jgi:hypothetical protein